MLSTNGRGFPPSVVPGDINTKRVKIWSLVGAFLAFALPGHSNSRSTTLWTIYSVFLVDRALWRSPYAFLHFAVKSLSTPNLPILHYVMFSRTGDRRLMHSSRVLLILSRRSARKLNGFQTWGKRTTHHQSIQLFDV